MFRIAVVKAKDDHNASVLCSGQTHIEISQRIIKSDVCHFLPMTETDGSSDTFQYYSWKSQYAIYNIKKIWFAPGYVFIHADIIEAQTKSVASHDTLSKNICTLIYDYIIVICKYRNTRPRK